ncbi:MAG: 5,10-methylenetetrahydrofolate reductase [Deltaproteobacteria bacterium CG_4_8_14_3_um_filter_51_11]|nr:methylenetetrahydrofolate reductase [bacterium]OIP41279.1 MAG: 5,10-methylenetetrahydrofolate reductase [Desulfobacteraceae bacterium CG2_30_51_40]PIP47792.1 MAG: 5,10-methylenetetrahydrofolate reductase [Deltaproteobacteria bacterium CG23_combo_of_CG06-09_8_20_14_all_51_20]PIX18161.1 MAG: 5,10-methylenetetrahydrofolate reductase [Deltaproteobacteria bacterium CG_4_8_14_3_um_filter_51_11]PIY23446.1 MAG: 5,10-methylenetetrahydrofolate reductase [Deltaproteobacteria bacterium CG_4_10_14_3_um_f
MKDESRLKQLLDGGHFAVTAECGPPKGADPGAVLRKAGLLKEKVDAVNVTDNQTAIVRMSSIAACTVLLSAGLEPVLQMVVRDRNRIALQSDVLGASALGIRNILCLSGDHQSFGNQPSALGVFDLDSMQFIEAVRGMRDAGTIMGGEQLTSAPAVFIGAAANPFADPLEFRVVRLAKKISAGAEFIQTQCIYNMERFKKWISLAEDRGLLEKAYILGGVTPLKSAGMAKYMKNKVAGMDIPDDVIKRMDAVPKERQRQEGIGICVETILALKEIKGVKGIHIMAIEWEDAVGEIVERAGLLPRPKVD